MFVFGIFVVLVGSLGLTSSQAQDGFHDYVRLFDYIYHKGTSWKIDLPEDDSCVEFPSDAQLKTSSILTNGNCVILHNDGGCHGRGLRFEDFSYGYDDFLYLWYADNTHRSLRRCPCNTCTGHSSGGSREGRGRFDGGGGTTPTTLRAY